MLQGVLSANSPKETHSAKISHNTDTALILKSPKWALIVENGSTLVKNITCNNILITNSFTIQTAVVFGNNMIVGGDTTLYGELSVGKSLYVDNGTLFVNSTSNKVGIKTTTPNKELTVIGDISGTGNINVSQGIYSNSGFYFNPFTASFYTNAYTKIDNSLDVLTNFSLSGSLLANSDATVQKDLTVAGNVLYVKSNTGRVGINTLTPSSDLHVVGSTTVSQNVLVGNSIGIGTNTPNKQLTVQGEISATRHLNVGNGALYVNTDKNYVGVNVTIPTLPWPSLSQNTLAVNGVLSAAGSTILNGTVGVNTDTPNKTFTVVGDISATGSLDASIINMQSLNIEPTKLSFVCQLSTFTTPVTATGDFLVVKLNGTQKAIRLWNF